jgi:hypothetical protein
MAKGYTIESLKRVYDDGSGDYVQISPDADGLDCVDIRQYNSKGEIYANGQARITMSQEMAEKLSLALQAYLAETKREQER